MLPSFKCYQIIIIIKKYEISKQIFCEKNQKKDF